VVPGTLDLLAVFLTIAKGQQSWQAPLAFDQIIEQGNAVHAAADDDDAIDHRGLMDSIIAKQGKIMKPWQQPKCPLPL
jgi:hypothetical protein